MTKCIAKHNNGTEQVFDNVVDRNEWFEKCPVNERADFKTSWQVFFRAPNGFEFGHGPAK
tara:strand:+ start:103 stop:282 length:180 start_codon:yes stop_codon:yes gene_type:complete